MPKKLMVIFLAVALLTGLAAGCQQASAPKTDEILIGSVMCMSGALGPMGEKIDKAARLAVDEINKAGGVNGKQLKIITEDDATEAAKALEAVKKLVEVNGAKFIVGPMTSGAVDTVGPYVSERKVLLVSPSATSALLTGRDYRNFVFRTPTSDDFQGVIMAQLALDAKVKKAVIFTMDNTYGVGLGDVAKQALEKEGVQILAYIKYDEKTLDYLSELTQIKGLNPDVVIHVGYNEDGKVVYRQANELGLDKILWVAPDGIHGSGTLDDPSAGLFASKAVIGTRPVGDTEADKYQAFVKKYNEVYGISPDVFTDTTYDAVMLLAKAMQHAKSEDPAKVRDALLVVGSGYEGASGTITFTPGGDRASGMYEVWKVEKVDGVYKNVGTRIITVE
ncbi:MAG: ABC transporter substrate-binding protein [Bacillota bacterium]